MFGFGGGGVVAELRDTAGDVGPDRAEIKEIFFEERFSAAGDAERVRAVEGADARRAGFEAVLAERERNVVEVIGADLDDRAELFGEEGREHLVALRNLEVDAGVAGEGHFEDGGEKAAVGAVVVGEKFFLATEELDRVPEFFEVGGVVDVRGGFAHLRNSLREDGAAEAVLAAAEIDQEQEGVLLLIGV